MSMEACLPGWKDGSEEAYTPLTSTLNASKMLGATRKFGTLTYEFDIKVIDDRATR